MELIKISNTSMSGSTIQTVNAKELHTNLKIGKDFSTWVKDRINKYGFTENVDFVCSPVLGSEGRGGNNRIDYHISVDMAKELSMVERTDEGRRVRQYFIECERKSKSVVQLVDLNDPIVLRGMLLIQVDKVIELNQIVTEQAPKVVYHDAVTESSNCHNFTEAAKILKIGRNTLYAFLRESGLLTRGNIPYQVHLDNGRFKVIETTYYKEGKPYISYKVLVTGKGMIYLQKKLSVTS